MPSPLFSPQDKRSLSLSRFAARTVHSGSLMLVTVELKEGSTAQLIINTEKTVIGSVLLRELKPVLSQG